MSKDNDVTVGAFVFRPLVDKLYVRQFSGEEFIRWQALSPKVNGSVAEQMEFLATVTEMVLYEIPDGGQPHKIWTKEELPAILECYPVPFLKRVVVTALDVSELRSDAGAELGKQ